jgi:four helix bundle protein
MDDKIQTFIDLNVWKKAHKLALNIYNICNSLPTSEQYTLADQLKRSSSAVTISITEGFQKRNKQEKINLYNDAQSALTNLYYLLILTKDLNYWNTDELLDNTHEVQKMMSGLIRSISGISKPVGFNKSQEQYTSSVADEEELM